MRRLAALVLLLAASPAVAQEKLPDPLARELGASTYRAHCATCHGPKGEGDGPMAGALRFAPADLTRIASRNKGVFSLEKVVRIIDGREPVKGHGGPDMPIWGDAFLDPREGFSAEKVREKITQVAHYLESIQKK